jgi:hypothetical protein
LLSSSGIKEEAGDVLGQLLEKNSTICSLRLQNNQLGYGVMDFGRSLRLNSSVCVLNVGSNRLGDPGADVLAGVLRVNRSLTSLNVSNNGFTEKGGQAIASGLASNPVLTSLNISNNAVRDSSCIELSGSLIQNQCISGTSVCLRVCGVYMHIRCLCICIIWCMYTLSLSLLCVLCSLLQYSTFLRAKLATGESSPLCLLCATTTALCSGVSVHATTSGPGAQATF